MAIVVAPTAFTIDDEDEGSSIDVARLRHEIIGKAVAASSSGNNLDVQISVLRFGSLTILKFVCRFFDSRTIYVGVRPEC